MGEVRDIAEYAFCWFSSQVLHWMPISAGYVLDGRLPSAAPGEVLYLDRLVAV